MLPPGLRVLPVEAACNPGTLRRLFHEPAASVLAVDASSTGGATVAPLRKGLRWCIVGGSHSGMLVAMNLLAGSINRYLYNYSSKLCTLDASFKRRTFVLP